MAFVTRLRFTALYYFFLSSQWEIKKIKNSKHFPVTLSVMQLPRAIKSYNTRTTLDTIFTKADLTYTSNYNALILSRPFSSIYYFLNQDTWNENILHILSKSLLIWTIQFFSKIKFLLAIIKKDHKSRDRNFF